MTAAILHQKGERFGRLTLTGKNKTVNKRKFWEAQCDCGYEAKYYDGWELRNGRAQYCGGARTELPRRSGRSLHPVEYKTYYGFLRRCYKPRHKSYKDYGGRGITVCDRWLESFENFYADMGDRPEGYTLDRIDNDKGYEPGNCRWATIKEQNRNRSCSVWVEYQGREWTLKDLSDWSGISHGALYLRYRKGKRGDDLVRGSKSDDS